MNTPAHVLIGIGLLGNRIKPNMVAALFVGSLMPDIPAFIFYIYQKIILGTPESIIWSEKYFQANWNYVFDIFHSIPIFLVAIGLFYVFDKPWGRYFFAAALLHCGIDMAVHNDDAHRHFLPLFDYKFISPISYWDSRHYGQYVMVFEIITALFFTSRYLKNLPSQKIKYGLYSILFVYLGNILVGFYHW